MAAPHPCRGGIRSRADAHLQARGFGRSRRVRLQGDRAGLHGVHDRDPRVHAPLAHRGSDLRVWKLPHPRDRCLPGRSAEFVRGDVRFSDRRIPVPVGRGTPTSYGASGKLAPGADPQRTNYVGVKIDADKRTTAIVYVDRTFPVDHPGAALDVTLTALSRGRQIGAPLTRRITDLLPYSSTPWVAPSERSDPTYGVQFQVPRELAPGSR